MIVINLHRGYFFAVGVALLAAGCVTAQAAMPQPARNVVPAAATAEPTATTPAPTPVPTLPPPTPTVAAPAAESATDNFYRSQPGDTVPALAGRFGVSEGDLRASNPTLPMTGRLVAPGSKLLVTMFDFGMAPQPQVIPDNAFVYGPLQDLYPLTNDAAQASPWLASVRDKDGDTYRADGWQVLQKAARTYSINPRLLLALLEYESGLYTGNTPTKEQEAYPFGLRDWQDAGFSNQVRATALLLNEGYYGWRGGTLRSLTLADGWVWRLDPRLNAGSVALYNLLAQFSSLPEFERAVGPNGIKATLQSLFGEAAPYNVDLLPATLQQPQWQLPFTDGVIWNFTGGPHPVIGDSQPWGAIDFAPGLTYAGCDISGDWVVAVADGVVARISDGVLMLDLDGDGRETTGWVMMYVHMEVDTMNIIEGKQVRAGTRLGHPGCAGETRSTSTHVHMARKYNGEWIAADGPLPFELGGWRAIAGAKIYQGKLVSARLGSELEACMCVADNQVLSASVP